MTLTICRLCSKQDTNLSSVFEATTDEANLATKILLCFGVRIREDDKITRNICKSCFFFTNSAYEHRVSSLANDAKLWKEYYESQRKNLRTPTKTHSPDVKITQNAFLNTLNLTSSASPPKSPKKNLLRGYHISCKRLKQKYPDLIIPHNCRFVDLNPYVAIDDTLCQQSRTHSPKLGIWSVNAKKNPGRPNGVVLTRVRSKTDLNSVDEYSNSECDFSKDGLPSTPKSIIKRNKSKDPNCIWLQRKKKNRKKMLEKGISSPTTKSPISPEKNITSPPVKQKKLSVSEENSTKQAAKPVEVQSIRNQLKSLLKSDEYLTKTISKLTSVVASSSQNHGGENSLFLSVGEEQQTFICQTCNKIFDTQISLKNHKRFNHKYSLQCTKCSKKFSVVENLMKHYNVHHPDVQEEETKPEQESRAVTASTPEKTSKPETVKESVAEPVSSPQLFVTLSHVSPQSEAETNVPRKRTARKRTGGNVAKKSTGGVAKKSKKTIEIEEFIISSDEEDDDCEITNVTNNDTSTIDISEETEKQTEETMNVLDKALMPQIHTKNQIEETKSPTKKTSLLEEALTPQLLATNLNEDLTDVVTTPMTPEDTSSQVHVIEDSDNEDNATSVVSETPNLEVPSISKEEPISNSPNHSILPDRLKKKLVVKEETSKSLSINQEQSSRQLKNEENYIKYIFNKCKYDNKEKTSSSTKWILKDFKTFTDKSYVSVEVNRSVDVMSVMYVGYAISRIKKKFGPRNKDLWEAKDAIHFPWKTPTPPVSSIASPTNPVSSTSNSLDTPLPQEPANLDPAIISVPPLQQISKTSTEIIIPLTSNSIVTSSSPMPLQLTSKTDATVTSHSVIPPLRQVLKPPNTHSSLDSIAPSVSSNSVVPPLRQVSKPPDTHPSSNSTVPHVSSNSHIPPLRQVPQSHTPPSSNSTVSHVSSNSHIPPLRQVSQLVDTPSSLNSTTQVSSNSGLASLRQLRKPLDTPLYLSATVPSVASNVTVPFRQQDSSSCLPPKLVVTSVSSSLSVPPRLRQIPNPPLVLYPVARPKFLNSSVASSIFPPGSSTVSSVSQTFSKQIPSTSKQLSTAPPLKPINTSVSFAMTMPPHQETGPCNDLGASQPSTSQITSTFKEVDPPMLKLSATSVSPDTILPPMQQITNKTINIALPVKPSATQQKVPLYCYQKKTKPVELTTNKEPRRHILFKQILKVSPTVVQEQETAPKIVVKQQPIVLNGIPYPTLTKNWFSAPTNTSQTDSVEQVRQNEQLPLVPDNNLEEPVTETPVSSTLLPENQLDKPEPVPLPYTKPSIRIKDISELREKKLNPIEQQRLHDEYIEILTRHVNNRTDDISNSTNNTDANLRIA